MRAAGASLILALAVVAGCGPGRRTAAAPATPAVGAATGERTDVDRTTDGAGGTAPAVEEPLAPAPPPVTADECGLLVDRLIAIGLAEQHARDPRAPQATAEQQAGIRAQLLAQALPSCATLPRASWACAMAAGDRAAMIACEATAAGGPP